MEDIWSHLGAGHRAALDAARGLPPSASYLDRLSRRHGAEAARWAFEQWELRTRARTKFARAEAMLFDRDGLEMATHEELAWVHSMTFPAGEAAADLTCGIGADLIALARSRPAVGFEVDPLRAAMARHNLAVHGLVADIRLESCLEASWDFAYAVADPSRRKAGRRVLEAGDYDPPLDTLSSRMRGLKGGSIKVSPMLKDETLGQHGDWVEFVSFGGECREAIVRFGPRAKGSPSGEVLAFHAETSTWLTGQAEPEPSVEAPLKYVFEADPAAIRAHSLGTLGECLEAVPLGNSNGYLTGSEPASDPGGRAFSRAFEVVGHGRADAKRIRQDLRKLGASVEAVKVRGVKEEPRAWLDKLKSEGPRRLLLILYPVGKSVRYALIEPRP